MEASKILVINTPKFKENANLEINKKKMFSQKFAPFPQILPRGNLLKHEENLEVVGFEL